MTALMKFQWWSGFSFICIETLWSQDICRRFGPVTNSGTSWNGLLCSILISCKALVAICNWAGLNMGQWRKIMQRRKKPVDDIHIRWQIKRTEILTKRPTDWKSSKEPGKDASGRISEEKETRTNGEMVSWHSDLYYRGDAQIVGKTLLINCQRYDMITVVTLNTLTMILHPFWRCLVYKD